TAGRPVIIRRGPAQCGHKYRDVDGKAPAKGMKNGVNALPCVAGNAALSQANSSIVKEFGRSSVRRRRRSANGRREPSRGRQLLSRRYRNPRNRVNGAKLSTLRGLHIPPPK